MTPFLRNGEAVRPVDFLIGAAPKIVFAFWLGVAVVILAAVMLTVILVMRQVMARRERNHQRAAVEWRTILVAADAGAPVKVPSLPRGDVTGFLEVWNELHAAHPGDRGDGLLHVAAEVGLDRHLFRLLGHGGFHNQVVAIIALGHLRNRDHFARVAQFIDDKSPIVSLCAARALMQMDPSSAVSMFVPQIVSRDDWSQGRVAAILHETSTPALSKELSLATLRANADVAPRLVRFLAAVSPEEVAPVIRTILTSSVADDHLISTCLQVLSRTADLVSVRPLLKHPRWHVRMHAAAAIGRLGVPGDERLLVDMLSDEQWWVRYRTAQGLLKLPFLDESRVRRIRDTHPDRFARDILDHVLAERDLKGAHA